MPDAQGTDPFTSSTLRSIFEPNSSKSVANDARKKEQGYEPLSEVPGIIFLRNKTVHDKSLRIRGQLCGFV